MQSNGTLNMEPDTFQEDPYASQDKTSDKDIDFVLVWDESLPNSITEKSMEKRRVFESNLEKEGLILEREKFPSKQLNFVKIHAPLEVLKRYAEILKMRMPIKEICGLTDVHQTAISDWMQSNAPSFITKTLNACFGIDETIFPKTPKRITTTYSRDKDYLFDMEGNESECFTPAIRSRIVLFILRRKRYREGEGNDLAFGFARLISKNVYCSGYPLHDGDYKSISCQRGLLLRHWGLFRNMLKYQPLDTIKQYFGVQIGLYYAWLGFYARMLIPASLLGLVCIFYGFATVNNDTFTLDVCNKNITMCPLCDNCDSWSLTTRCMHSQFTYYFDNDATALFALAMSIWTAVYLELWKRYCNELTHQWDLSSFDEKDRLPRPEFLARLKDSGKKRINFVTNTLEPAIPFWRMKVPLTIFSYSSLLFLISVALAAVFGVIVFRIASFMSISHYVTHDSLKKLFKYQLIIVNVTAAIINLSFIMLFSLVYKSIASRLTDIEIPRTQQDYEASYAFKLYVLQFINHYSSLFYIAYFKGNFIGTPDKYNRLFGKWRNEECSISCMPELCIQLAIIMTGKQIKNAVLEMVIPLFRKVYKHAKLRFSQEKVEVIEHQISKDYQLLDVEKDSLALEYLDMVIQFGFVTIFVAAFPLAPLFALINNVMEVRIDAQKLLKYYKRPVARRVKGIGIWYEIMDSLAKFAVLSNAFLIAITSNFIPKLMYRFFYYNPNNKRYGTLDGFLGYSLTIYDTKDIDMPQNEKNGIINLDSTCSFPGIRNNYDSKHKYDFSPFHWKLWLGRMIFVIVFQNIVAFFFVFVRWAIPDMPSSLREEMQRDEFLTNELVILQELIRARGFGSEEGELFTRSRKSQDPENQDETGNGKKETPNDDLLEVP